MCCAGEVYSTEAPNHQTQRDHMTTGWMSPRRVLLLATNKLLRICRVGESPDRALFKLHRVPGITLSSRNGPIREIYMVARAETTSGSKGLFFSSRRARHLSR